MKLHGFAWTMLSWAAIAAVPQAVSGAPRI